MTNYEKIKNMSADELCLFIYNLYHCSDNCPMKKHCEKVEYRKDTESNMTCDNTWLIDDWLESEADENEN